MLCWVDQHWTKIDFRQSHRIPCETHAKNVNQRFWNVLQHDLGRLGDNCQWNFPIKGSSIDWYTPEPWNAFSNESQTTDSLLRHQRKSPWFDKPLGLSLRPRTLKAEWARSISKMSGEKLLWDKSKCIRFCDISHWQAQSLR